jgi:hypothetical protein
MFQNRILTISIAADLKNQNTGQTRHWSTAHREKKLMTLALRDGQILYPGDGNLKFGVFCREIMPHPFDSTVDVTVKRILGKGQRLFDPDSILRGNCKQLIDAVVDAKLLVDDSSKHIGRVLGLQDATQRERGPAIEISFWEHENEPSPRYS